MELLKIEIQRHRLIERMEAVLARAASFETAMSTHSPVLDVDGQLIGYRRMSGIELLDEDKSRLRAHLDLLRLADEKKVEVGEELIGWFNQIEQDVAAMLRALDGRERVTVVESASFREEVGVLLP